jgi:predicted phage tail protein
MAGSFEKRSPRSRQALMKIVLVVVGPLFIALELFWFGQAAGLLSGPHNAVLIDVGASVAALGIGLGWFALR